MGVAKLEISSNIQGLMDKIDSLTASVAKLTGNTDEYSQRSTAGFNKAAQSADQLNTEIKEQQKIIKDMTREAEKLAKTQTKHTDEQAKAYKRLQGDIKVATQELKQMQGQQEKVHASAGKGTEMFKKMGAAIAGAFTVAAIISFSKQSVAAYQDQIRAEAKLRTALKGQEGAIKNLIRQSNELQRTTLFGDDQIVNAQGLLAMYVKEESQLKKLTPLVLDFAQAKGMDLASAANLVGKTFGSSTNSLTRYGIEVEGVSGSSQRFNDIMEGLTKTVQGQAEGALTDEERALRQATVATEEFKESWGKLTLSLTNTGLFGSLSETIDYLSWGLNKAQESGGRFKDWWGWFWQTGDYGSEVFEMERRVEKNAELYAENAKAFTQKTGGKTYGDLVNEWIDAGSINQEVESLDSLKAKLEELKKEQSAAPLDQFTSFQPAIDALEAQIALYEKKKEKEAKSDKERVKSTAEENLKTLDKYVEEANKKTFDIELGFGGMQSAEEFQKQIDDNLKDFEFTMDLNPQFSTDSSAEAKAWDDAYKLMQDNLADFEKIQQETWERMLKFAEDHPWAAALGFDNEEQLEQIKEYAGQILDYVNELVDQEVEARSRLVDDWNQKIDEQQELVNRENEDKAEGLANNYELEQQNLANMQKARDQAVKDREKSIKLQRTLSTIESGIALVTASANIIKGFSTIPVVGVVLGLLAVGAMIAGFIAASASAKSATQMEEGGQAHGLLKGKRHSQGGIPIEAEEGEWFINRHSSEKYSPLLDAINRDDQQGMKLYFDRKFVNKFNNQRSERDYTKHLKDIERNTRNKKSELIYGNGFIIERIGGYTKKINLN